MDPSDCDYSLCTRKRARRRQKFGNAGKNGLVYLQANTFDSSPHTAKRISTPTTLLFPFLNLSSFIDEHEEGMAGRQAKKNR